MRVSEHRPLEVVERRADMQIYLDVHWFIEFWHGILTWNIRGPGDRVANLMWLFTLGLDSTKDFVGCVSLFFKR